jgi:hypothetical protein
MGIKSSKDGAKKKASKPAKVVDFETYAKKREALATKVKRLQEVRTIARKMGIDRRNASQKDLIRAIQRAEGNHACFATSSVQTCGQVNCLWRADCEEPSGSAL